MAQKNNFKCSTCGAVVERLFQSYADGSLECATCALGDAMMPAHVRASVEKHARREAQHERRAATARRNFNLDSPQGATI